MNEAENFVRILVSLIFDYYVYHDTSNDYEGSLEKRIQIETYFQGCKPMLGLLTENLRTPQRLEKMRLQADGTKTPTVFQIKKYRYGTRADDSDRIIYRFYIGTHHGSSGAIYAELYYGEVLEGEWKVITTEHVNHYERQPYFEHRQGEFIGLESLELLEVRKFEAPLDPRDFQEYNSE